MKTLREVWQAARRALGASSPTRRVAIGLAALLIVFACSLLGIVRLSGAAQRLDTGPPAALPTPTTNTLPPLTGATLGGQLAKLQTAYPSVTGAATYTVVVDGTKLRLETTELVGMDGQKHLGAIRLRTLEGAKRLTDERATALLQVFLPPDSRHDRDLPLRTGALEQLYWNGSLAATFPATAFRNAANIPVGAGVFAIVIEHDEEETGTDDCRIAVGAP